MHCKLMYADEPKSKANKIDTNWNLCHMNLKPNSKLESKLNWNQTENAQNLHRMNLNLTRNFIETMYKVTSR